MRLFWGSLTIQEDMSGLFGSLDTLNPAKNNHSTPVWSLIQAYLFFKPTVSQCGLPTHKILSTLTLGPFAQPHPQFSSEHTDWFSWTVSLILYFTNLFNDFFSMNFSQWAVAKINHWKNCRFLLWYWRNYLMQRRGKVQKSGRGSSVVVDIICPPWFKKH